MCIKMHFNPVFPSQVQHLIKTTFSREFCGLAWQPACKRFTDFWVWNFMMERVQALISIDWEEWISGEGAFLSRPLTNMTRHRRGLAGWQKPVSGWRLLLWSRTATLQSHRSRASGVSLGRGFVEGPLGQTGCLIISYRARGVSHSYGVLISEERRLGQWSFHLLGNKAELLM